MGRPQAQSPIQRFPDLLWQQVRERPDAVAARELDGRSLTWRALGARVAALAARLRRLGVAPEVRVGVCLDRSLDLLVALLGLHEAGGVYVPLDPSLPDRRLQWLGQDADLALVLVEGATRARVEAPMLLRVDLEHGEDGPDPDPSRPGPETAAYVIYTSGSTGAPKGVVVEHRSLVALARALPGRFRAGPRSRLLQYSSLAFDVSFFDFALWLGSGAPLVLAPAARLAPGPALHRCLAEGRITHLTCTPTVLGALSEQGLPHLRHLMIGGEPMPPDLVRRFGPGRHLHNVYGPTEATVAATAHRVAPGEDWPPIGRPIGAAQVRVADADGRPLPTGVSGELLLGGPGVARGYLGRPELTAARFWTDPDTGARWYRSGDRGHRRPDGALVFEGRLDEQVKVRGVRVEPGEVEQCLRAHPDVAEAVVAARREGTAPARLLAWVVPRPGATTGPAEWRAHAARHLPDAFVPSAIVRLDALPLLPSSKVDRAALPPPSRERPDLPTPFQPPGDPLQARLAALFAEVLQLDRVGVDDDFYALGGDSLAAMRLLAGLAAALGQELAPTAFAARPTVRAAAEALGPGAGDAGAPRLTFGQEGLWVRHRLDPRATGDHLPAVLHLRGRLRPAALGAAFAAVVARHEALRLAVADEGGRPTPRALPADDPRLALPRAEPVRATEAEGAALKEHVLRLLEPPFDLAAGPPWRARLLRAAPDHHLLLLAFHHLAVDADALGLLLEELAQALDGHPLPAAAAPWTFAAEERARHARGELEPSLAWWAEALRDGPAFSGLPPDLPGGGSAPRRGALRPLHLPAPAVDALLARARPLGLTPFQALLTALGRALEALGAGPGPRIATPVARRRPGAPPCLGFFANTVVVPLPGLSGLPADLALAGARDAARAAFAHADAPFPLVLARVDPPRGSGHDPLFQVVLALQAPLPARRTASGLRLELDELQAPTAPFPLTVELWPEADGGLRGAVLYDRDAYSPGRIEALVARLEAEVAALARPEAAAGAPPPAWVTGAPLPPPGPETDLARALLRTADRHGDHALAFVEGDGDTRTLGYAELLDRATALARGLAALGLRAGDRVVLQQDGLLAHTVHFWACLLAGVVPLSVAVPRDRRADRPAAEKLAELVRRLDAAVLASPALVPSLAPLLPAGTRLLSPAPDPGPLPAGAPGPVAFLQASSGTTGRVKLIPETHAAVLAHVRAVTAHCGYGPGDRTLSWLPFDHVASLLMCHVKDTVIGARQVHARTDWILAEPLRLLDLVQAHRVTHTLSPDFGLALVAEALEARRATGDPGSWDLRSLRRIANGAETVKPSTLARFLERTAPFGLDPAALQPGFGMAETASVVCFDDHFRLDRDRRWVRREGNGGWPVRVEGPGPGAVPVVSLGGPLPGVELRIVDEAGRTRAEGEVGRLLVRGEMVFAGYLDGEAGGPAPDGWFDTGDLGLLEAGTLSLVGRARETIVVRGAKVQAEEVEQVLADLPGLAAGGVAAVALPDGEGETLGLFLVPRPDADEAALERAARARLAEALGLSAGVVRVVGPEALPRTSAGKLRRPELVARFLAGAHPALPPLAVWVRDERPMPAPDGPPPATAVALLGAAPALRAALEEALGRPCGDEAAPVRVVVAPEGDPGPVLAALRAPLADAGPGRLLLVGGRDARVDAAMAGALATLRLERPGLRARLVAVPEAPVEAARAIAAELAVADGPPEVDARGPRRVATLAPTGLGRRHPSPFAAGGHWLLTGGLGGLGRRLARDLVRQHGAHLLLVGRRPPDEAAEAALRALVPDEAGGAGSVRHAALDVADAPALARAVAQAEAAWGAPLSGVLHLAGVYEPRPVEALDEAHLERTLRARHAGMAALATLLHDRPEAWLVAFGSAAGHLGARESLAYAAACRVQAAWVEALRAGGHARARSVEWGAFANVGMRRGAASEPALDPAIALPLLERVLADGRDLVVAAARPPEADAAAGPPDAAPDAAPASPGEARIRAVIADTWRALLDLPSIDPAASFFALGGHSVLLVQAHARLEAELGRSIPIAELFRNPTLHGLARALAGEEPAAAAAPGGEEPGDPVVIVGMAGRFPLAPDVETLWERLCAGQSSATRRDRDALLAAGVPAALVDDPRYVPVRATLEEADRFDAAFFGMSPAEAARTDPQHRLLLECAWEALEHAGVDPGRFEGPIGIFAGAGLQGWLGAADAEEGEPVQGLAAILGNDKDHLAPRVAHKLDLRGPAITVQTACSTSLVAVHQACRALRAGDCALALAGGVNVGFPLGAGHLHQPGHIASPDGLCRAFDAGAAGTFGGDGVGLVVLTTGSVARRLGLRVLARVRGSAVNNDGARKAAYTAPGVEGQVAVIRAAVADAGLPAAAVGYVEAHGTGTALGDPVEVAALGRALGPRPDGQVRHLGAVKPNLGHGNTAAGVASLIKATFAVERGLVPPLLHFRAPNPRLDLAAASLAPCAAPTRWTEAPRRAGVSAFGFGGTNVHVILESPPPEPARPPADPGPRLLPVSGQDEAAVRAVALRLAAHLEAHPDLRLDDVATTLQLGRRPLPERAVYRARDLPEAVRALRGEPVARGRAPTPRGVAFLFPGQGAQHPGMLRGLYDREPVVRARVDAGAEALRATVGTDLRSLLLAPPDDAEAARRLTDTAVAQPALFLVELALGELWLAQGVRPVTMLGHSLGEWAAAALAGVFEADDALRLVALRGALCARAPEGVMLSVALPAAAVTPLLGDELEVAAENAPDQVVIGGPPPAVAALEAALRQRGVAARRLPGDRAFHTRAMAPAARDLEAALHDVRLAPPRLPLLCSLTGRPMAPEEATDPVRWARQLTAPVRFAAALERLLEDPERLLVEVGPRRGLGALARRRGHDRVVASLAGADPPGGDAGDAWHGALAAAFVQGVDGSPPATGRRVALPTYPFARRRHAPAPARAAPRDPAVGLTAPPTPGRPPRPLVLLGRGDAALRARLAAAGGMPEAPPAADAGALAAWFAERRAAGRVPDTLLLWHPGPEEAAALVQALARRLFRTPLTVLVVPPPASARTEDRADPPSPPAAERDALALGLVLAAPRLLPALRVRALPAATGETVDLDPLAAAATDGATADDAPPPAPRPPAEPPAGDDPVLVLDGPRGLGLAWAERLAAQGRRVALRPRAPAEPDPAALGAALDRALDRRDLDPGDRADLDALCAGLVLRFLEGAGVDLSPGAAVSREALRARLGVRPAFHRLLDAMLAMAVEDGHLAVDGADLRATGRRPPAPEAIAGALRARRPGLSGLLDLIAHGAAHHRPAISGQVDAIGVLYPGGRGDLVEDCERRTVEYRADRRQILLLVELLRREALRVARPDRPLRILELGGGQGLLTWPLLVRLRDLPVELHFTDIGATFVEDARREARRRGLEARMRAHRLDLSRPPDPAHFPPGHYDAVVAYNVLHAVPDLPTTLDRLRPLLAPGGLLGVVEILRTERWDVLTWGLAEGWWAWADAVRTDGPLLSAPAWRALLADRGYREPRAYADGRPGEGPIDHALLLARAPGPAAAPADAARLHALAALPGARVLPAELDPARARRAATEALGGAGAVLVEPADGVDLPLLARDGADALADLAAARGELRRVADAAPDLPRVLLVDPEDPDGGPRDRALAAGAAGLGFAVLPLPPRAPSAPAPGPAPTPGAASPAAADGLAARIAGLAAEVLGVPHLGPDEDFVAHGADSLVMLRLTDRITRELGHPVPTEAAFAGTTARRLAAAVAPPSARAPAPATGPLVLLQPNGEGRPFFMVHPATGVVFPYYRLARAMGEARPFYALQARGLDGSEPVDTRVEDMARHYLRAIRAVQPRGPYHLGGFSFGCLVAHELAVQLAEAGEPLGLVALVDEPAPIDGYRPSPALMAGLIAGGARDALLPYLPEYLAWRRPPPAAAPGPGIAGSLEELLARLTLAGFVPEAERPLALRQPAMRQLFRLFLLHARLTLTYEPRALPHRLTLLKATDLRGRAARDPTQGWRMLAAGGVEVHRLPGEHLTLLREPHVAEVARLLNDCLRRAEA